MIRSLCVYSRAAKIPKLSVNLVSSLSSSRFYSVHNDSNKVTVNTIQRNYKEKRPITMMTATDFHSGSMVDGAAIDMVLVGDSLAMTALGYDDTTQVTMDEMLHHVKAVSRGVKNAFLVADMPFGSYEESPSIAVRNAFRFIKEGKANAVKLEGGERVAKQVRAIVESGIPVIGHIGLTPQSINAIGGYHTVGKTSDEALKLIDDAKALEYAGCTAIVLECVPERVAEKVTSHLHIPTIGIGSGKGVSGQVLVYHDTLGMFDRFTPKFCKQYAKLNSQIAEALKNYRDEVVNRTFPSQEYSFRIKKEELTEFMQNLTIEDMRQNEEEELSNMKLLAAAAYARSENLQYAQIGS